MKLNYIVDKQNCLKRINVLEIKAEDINDKGVLEIAVPAIIDGIQITTIGRRVADYSKRVFLKLIDLVQWRLDKIKVIKFNIENGPKKFGYFSMNIDRPIIINIPSSIQKISDMCFYDSMRINFKEFYFENNSNLKEIGKSAFIKCIFQRPFVLPSKCTIINESAFDSAYFNSGFEFESQSNLKRIEQYAFNKTTINKNTLVIPNKVEIINDFAFARCKLLRRLDFSKAKDIKYFSSGAFLMSELEEIIINNNDNLVIKERCFEKAMNLKKVILPCFASNISPKAFYGFSKEKVEQIVEGGHFVDFSN